MVVQQSKQHFIIAPRLIDKILNKIRIDLNITHFLNLLGLFRFLSAVKCE